MVTLLACSLVGETQPVTLVPGTRAAALYGTPAAAESFACRYGVAPGFRSRLEAGGMVVSGVGPEGEVRIVELPAHPFFVATLFLPQARSTPGRPHPILAAYAAAVRARWPAGALR